MTFARTMRLLVLAGLLTGGPFGCKTRTDSSAVAADTAGAAPEAVAAAKDLESIPPSGQTDGPKLGLPDIPNVHHVEGDIYRGARPTPAGIAELGQLGVKTILSLETYDFDPAWSAQEEALASQNGIKMIRVPLSGILTPSLANVEKALAVLDDPANQPIFVHCLHGSDRTGIVVAFYRMHDDRWSVAEAHDEWMLYGHSKWLFYWDFQLQSFFNQDVSTASP